MRDLYVIINLLRVIAIGIPAPQYSVSPRGLSCGCIVRRQYSCEIFRNWPSRAHRKFEHSRYCR
jgi:hypothetical protein